MDKRDISKKDEIILQQLEVIRTMTENSLRRMGDDFWGPAAPPADAAAGGEVSPDVPAKDASSDAKPKDASSAGAGDGAPSEAEAQPPEKIEDLQAELEGKSVVPQYAVIEA